jgi:2-hydroxy-6-oxonona-2,4-dienedioate hydrolase
MTATAPAPSISLGTEPGDTTPLARSRWVEVDGVEVHARVWLDPSQRADPPVVLVHGLAVASSMCEPTGERLATRHHVYAPDLPGFGRSGKPDERLDVRGLANALGTWMEQMGLSGAVLVGTSIGCQIAVDLAARRADLVRGLVLASPTVDEDRRSWPEQMVRWQLEQTTQSLRMRLIMARDWARAGVRRALGTFRDCMHDPVEEKLPQVEQPALVLYGTRDPLISQEWAARVADTLPAGELHVLPGVVHNMAFENPLELARTTTFFIADRLPEE